MENKNEFQKELENLINRYSIENGSNTPDFILAEYLTKSLNVVNELVNERIKWYSQNNLIPLEQAFRFAKWVENLYSGGGPKYAKIEELFELFKQENNEMARD